MAPPIAPFPSFTTVNFYSGGTLNRLSWLRDDSQFLNSALHSPHARVLLLQNLNPLIWTGKGSQHHHHHQHDGQTEGGGGGREGEETHGREGYLATLTWDQVKGYVLEAAKEGSGKLDGNEDIFGPEAYGLSPPSHLEGKGLTSFEKASAGMGATEIAFVFLGVDEEGQEISSLPGQLATRQGRDGEQNRSSNVPAGTPYFALSLTYRSKSLEASVPSPLKALEDSLLQSGNYDFVDTRALGRAGEWPMRDAALVAQARALVDWNERNHFCPACSRRQYSLWGGYKRACASSLTKLGVTASTSSSGVGGGGEKFISSLMGGAQAIQEDPKDQRHGECPTTTTLSNCCYPRTDPVVIMGVLSPDGERLLLGRQRKWPPGFWSCLAGFLEVGESLEEAVRREVLEEAGVPIESVVYHSSQSWPFPSQLMIGAFGIAKSIAGHDLPPIRLDLDNELEEARWYTREEILAVLESSAKKHFSREDVKRIEEAQNTGGGRAGGGGGGNGGSGGDDPAKTQFTQKDPGSIANTDSNKSAQRDPSFKIPPSTAIAHVLIAAWARKEAILPLPGSTSNAGGSTSFPSPSSIGGRRIHQQTNM